MRIAVLADVHGNILALEAALLDVRRQKVDAIVFAGDIVVGSPDSNACWDLATSMRVPILRGNHERYVIEFGTPTAPPEWAGRQYLPIRWAAERATDERRNAMKNLRFSYSPPGFEEEILFVHASLRDDHDTIGPHTAQSDLSVMFPGNPPPMIVRAHNHVARSQAWEGRVIVTSGSVGLPLDGHTTAQYTIVTRRPAEWTFEHRWVEYDLDAALQRFHDTKYLDETGPMGVLFYRELATASYQILPFLRWYRRWLLDGPITLDVALDRFLFKL